MNVNSIPRADGWIIFHASNGRQRNADRGHGRLALDKVALLNLTLALSVSQVAAILDQICAQYDEVGMAAPGTPGQSPKGQTPRHNSSSSGDGSGPQQQVTCMPKPCLQRHP